ncbi:TetR/AcrR family transcriptional regulator [Curtobacterium herbarum]|uniref:TetR family transcriptional regulator C-terminal domain-containing protein n=1 Tax=Curtobacterium herbarum TaxID=150122 RepID=A0ABN1ZAX7_9MICO|nr:TetR family transcriptional regulator C-terminal domain-containing protein [Curtobacterium herbarum]MBM7476680.1 AcrR family transcriptional regulator [Curtobacterium herbarum]MCS6546202.1 TetR family transcriptional regulator C-terminal domain-containing protein [Curtobacterium herbarum]
MSRSIDLEERRRTVSAAACQVLARDGLGALSVRNVAAEAGLPPSTVRYAFPTQASVREHAIASVFDRTRERIDAIPGDLPTREWVRRVLVELLPLDDERVVELDVYLALGNAALTDAELRPTLDRVVDDVRRWCERVLEVLGVPEADREYEACRLHALLDGLAMHVARLAPGESGDWAIDVLERHVDGVARS